MKLKGLKKSIGDYQSVKDNPCLYAVIMMDTDSLELWTDIIMKGEWKEYHNKCIVSISGSMIDDNFEPSDINMKTVKEYINAHYMEG